MCRAGADHQSVQAADLRAPQVGAPTDEVAAAARRSTLSKTALRWSSPVRGGTNSVAKMAPVAAPRSTCLGRSVLWRRVAPILMATTRPGGGLQRRQKLAGRSRCVAYPAWP